MIILDFLALLLLKKKLLNSVFTKVPFFWDRILNDKSAFFPVTVIINKTNTNENLIGYLVYPEITQISKRSL